MSLADLYIADTPPPKLGAALVIIGSTLHEAFNAQPNIKPNWSIQSCIMASLTVRDFLRRAGFAAEVESVLCFIEAYDIFGKVKHTLGIGIEDHRKAKAKSITGWSGHLIVTVDGWLIDTTMFPAKRPAWPELPGMIAAPMTGGLSAYDLPALASLSSVDPKDGSYTRVRWLHQPRNRLWKRAADTEFTRRMPVINQMLAKWEEANAERKDSLER